MPRISNFDIEKQRADESIDDWVFGALSQPGIVSIPAELREEYLPIGEEQFDAFTDFNDCASRSPVNHAEALFTYHYEHNMKLDNKKWLEQKGYIQNGKVAFSDRFIAVLSGTTHSGNSLKAPLQAIHSKGLIPKKLLPKEDWMKWEDYYAPISQELIDLGQEFLKRFTINYEQVEVRHFSDVLPDDCVGVAAHAWEKPIDGVYPKSNGTFNHAFLLYDLPKFQAFDNYREFNPETGTMNTGDFTKNIAPDYIFYPLGYRVIISAENVPSDLSDLPAWQKNPLWAWLVKMILWLSNKQGPMPPLPPEILPVPTTVTNREKLHAAALSFIGRDASPNDAAPDELGCAESVNEIYKSVFGKKISEKNSLSTYWMYKDLKDKPRFEVVLHPAPGDIIISPTGYGLHNSPIPAGHVGIVTNNDRILSNNSLNGLWQDTYSLSSWDQRWGIKGGYPVLYFRVL